MGDVDAIHVVTTQCLQWTDSAPGTWLTVFDVMVWRGRVGEGSPSRDVDDVCQHDSVFTVDRFCCRILGYGI